MFIFTQCHLAASGLLLLLAGVGCQKTDSAPPSPPPTVPPTTTGPSQVAAWVTNANKSSLFARQRVALNFTAAANQYSTILVDTAQAYQTMDGFGYTLTGGSAMLINRMSAPARATLLRELFAVDSTWVGVSYLRLSIGASDLDEQVFSYDDLPTGQTDPALARFSLAPDRQHLIPVLKEILAINPGIKLLGSPWSPPVWMKTDGKSKGGSLKPEYYDAYARYFVKYIQGMAAEGIVIDAVTLQNEPLHPGNNPSMLMLATEQAEFIKNHVGPALVAAGLRTKIIAYDHNVDRPDYPVAVLSDPGAFPYVDGSAFHLYAGDISALSRVHDAFPTKHVYFTEQWVGAPGNFPKDLLWHTKNMFIGAPRNWSRTVLEWNLAADPQLNPHTPGGCTECLGALTIAGNAVTRNPAYYTVAHASKFVRPGSVRIDSNVPNDLPNVAFQTPGGKKVLIVLNTASRPLTFNIKYKGKTVSPQLSSGSVGTYVW